MDAIDVALTDLTDLAARINEEHDHAVTAIRAGLHHALEAGRLLLDAKAQVSHGGWLDWLQANCAVPERTAQLYMKLARDLPARLQGRESATVADLTIRDAVALLAERTGPMSDTSPNTEIPRYYILAWPVEKRQRLCREWWDQRAWYTLLLDAEGRTAPEVADTLGVSLDQVRRILHPQPPRRFHTVMEGGQSTSGESMFIGDVAPSYNALVEAFVLGWLSGEYGTAATLAAIEKPELVTPLEALEAHYKKRKEHLQNESAWGVFWGNPSFHDSLDDFTVPFWSCALTDARIAVGIEMDTGRTLIQMWRDYTADIAS